MTTAVGWLGLLQERGVDLSVAGEGLRFRAPRGVLTDDIKRALAEQQPVLVALLRATADSPALTLEDWLALPPPRVCEPPVEYPTVRELSTLLQRLAVYLVSGVRARRSAPAHPRSAEAQARWREAEHAYAVLEQVLQALAGHAYNRWLVAQFCAAQAWSTGQMQELLALVDELGAMAQASQAQEAG